MKFDLARLRGTERGQVLFLCNGPTLPYHLEAIQAVGARPKTIGMNRSFKVWTSDYYAVMDVPWLEEPAIYSHPRLIIGNGRHPRAQRINSWPHAPGFRRDADIVNDGVSMDVWRSVTIFGMSIAAYLGFEEFLFAGLDLTASDHFDGTPSSDQIPAQTKFLRKAIEGFGIPSKLMFASPDHPLLDVCERMSLADLK